MDAPPTARTTSADGQGSDRAYTFAEALEGSRTSLQTTATVRNDGGLDLTVSVLRPEHCATRIGVVVLLYDGCDPPEWIYTSAPVQLAMTVPAGQHGFLVGRFENTVDVAAMASARYIVVKHYLAPTDPWDDIKEWLGKAQAPGSGFQTVQGGPAQELLIHPPAPRVAHQQGRS